MIMNAVILAAGIGKRLSSVQEAPKCLLQMGGKTLLQRHIENLQNLGVERLVLCTGYQAQQIEAELQRIGAEDFCQTIFNPNYKKGSVLSLWHVREFLTTGPDVLLMDADVLYDRRVLERLCANQYTNGKTNLFLLDREFGPGDEPVKICVAGNRLVEFRKLLNDDLKYEFAGESVGFFRFDAATGARLARRTEHYIDNNLTDEPYEEAIRDLLLETPDTFDYVDVTGLAWVEIDFPEDIIRAQSIAKDMASDPQATHDD
jgi:choline kinase